MLGLKNKECMCKLKLKTNCDAEYWLFHFLIVEWVGTLLWPTSLAGKRNYLRVQAVCGFLVKSGHHKRYYSGNPPYIMPQMPALATVHVYVGKANSLSLSILSMLCIILYTSIKSAL